MLMTRGGWWLKVRWADVRDAKRLAPTHAHTMGWAAPDAHDARLLAATRGMGSG